MSEDLTPDQLQELEELEELEALSKDASVKEPEYKAGT